ncbi:DUF6093 family protein [Microbacterium sp. No. 7]|uniref:DUF6093 family protein n=1 Tax=Microbacterium sp. No. 7 TaxID=1714373 RepID=UPI0006D1E431|nr:DUF6093 family protein [Microbacterium sp. No. 7]ALJ19586.1 hypothetical protein AOA12_06550 [Microbacterium sp. No. 7]
MPLLPISATDDWEQEIADEAAEEFDASISVFLPGKPGVIDPITDEPVGATPQTTLISARPGRAQHVRLPLVSAGSSEWGTQQRYIIQFTAQAGDPYIPKGAFAKVSGGRDPDLANFTFNVSFSSQSTHRAVRTLRTIAEGPHG